MAALYDSASNGQEQQLAVTSTDPNGYFTFPCVDVLRASDGEPINPFVRAYYYSDSTQFNGVTAIIVRRSTLDEPIWTFDSNAIVACAGTDPNHSVLQMGSICPPSSNYGPNAAMYIYTTMLRGWDWLAQRLDFTNPNLVMNATAVRWTPMMWSESAMADTTGTIIDVAGAYEATGTYSPDELDENVLLHEYGHLIAHRYHFATSIVDTAKSHSLWTQSTVGNPPQASTAFAWSEGWADYFGVIASSTAAARTFTDIGIYSDSTTKDKFWGDLERGFAQTQNPLGNPTGSYSLNDSGATYEMTVAATLWDIFDASNDDQPPTGCSDAYAEDASHTFTLGAARGMTGTEKDILTFFSSYLNLHSGDLGPLCDLFCEHGLAPSQCNGGGGGGGGGGGQHDGGARTSGLARKVPSVWPEVDGTGAVRVLAFAAGADPARVDLFDVSGRRISTLWSGYVTVPGVPVRIPVPRSIGGSSMVFARLACSAGIASTRFVVIR
ncbi:MAG TPA: hypothetical protein VFK69_00865 [Candidatus Eisenbacteria bacterium]|nr:hypothetical protein [Candidatus Eisenbacteria bacterium]